MFSINMQGRIMVLQPLDREETDHYVLTIMAETLSSPPLVDLTEVHIKVPMGGVINEERLCRFISVHILRVLSYISDLFTQ